MLLTAAIGFSQDVFIYRPLRRGNPITLLIASIGLSYMLRNAVRFIWGSDLRTFDLPPSRGLDIGGYYVTATQLLMLAAAVAFLAILYFLLTRTLLGKSLRAAADNPELAAIMGISLPRVSAAVWVLASVFAAAGGILLALDTNLEPAMGAANLVKAFAAVLLGGAGNVWGALLGGVFIGIAENLGVAVFSPGYKDFVSFGLIFLLLLFRPRGLFGLFSGVR